MNSTTQVWLTANTLRANGHLFSMDLGHEDERAGLITSGCQ